MCGGLGDLDGFRCEKWMGLSKRHPHSHAPPRPVDKCRVLPKGGVRVVAETPRKFISACPLGTAFLFTWLTKAQPLASAQAPLQIKATRNICLLKRLSCKWLPCHWTGQMTVPIRPTSKRLSRKWIVLQLDIQMTIHIQGNKHA